MGVQKRIENKCGDCTYCCEVLSFGFTGHPPSEAVEFYKARGCVFHYLQHETMVTIEHKCPHLDKSFEVGCLIYKDRPEVCRKFDGRNNPVTKDKCKLRGKKNVG
jgi:Fe-S-cluster containining protein